VSYPNVHIKNSTKYDVKGNVVYNTFVCRDDVYYANPLSDWTAGSRGVCLVKEISGELSVEGKWIRATSYNSSGTSYSEFAVIQTKANPREFAVTRIATTGDEPPADYVEPTENQK